MCSNKHKTALSALQTRSTRPNKTTPNRNSARKTRTKTRKQKFISLRRNLTRDSPSPDSGEMNHHQHHQLDLFPLHPENLFEEKDIQDENVTCFFDSESGGGATLNGLLWGAGAGDDVASADEGSLTYTRRAQDSEEGAGYEYSLERTALRNRERDASEEKWVCYSEVVEEVTSCSTEYWSESRTQGLSLKLDYQEIMDAWVDKGPLYIDGEGPAIVPDVLDDALQQQNDCSTTMKVPVMGNGDEGEVGQNREARVLRYKEKRQSRLFAKRIRYEVRKLNAEKRPRIKGRFVKRS